MYLPEDIVTVIKEFSQPVTRPDWRTLHKMPYIVFHLSVLERFHLLFYDLAIHYHAMGNNVVIQYHVFKNKFLYSIN